jgi:Protein of unknown function (DUF2752)
VDSSPPAIATTPSARLPAAGVFLACAAVLGVSAWLRPDPRGYGTHEQLKMGRCGMLVTTGLPCPTCGMTTAFAHTVRGQWITAVRAQPAGFLLCLATAATALAAGRAALTGAWPVRALLWLTPYRLFGGLLLLLLGGWAYKALALRMGF